MMQVLAFLVVLGLLTVVIKLAVFVVGVIGLMRWPKETIGVLVALAAVNLMGRYPVTAGVPIGLLIVLGVYLKTKEANVSA